MSKHKVARIRTTRVTFDVTPTTLEANLASPMSSIGRRPPQAPGRTWFGDCAQVVVEVETDTGIVGLGTAGGFSAVPAAVIDEHLAPMMIGMDPFDVEHNWNVMYRSTARLGASGATMAAISGIDIACYDIMWLEEPLMAHDIAGYARLCRESPIPISHGEHQHTRYGFARLIEEKAAHILQPDVNRVGGITEARKIFAIAAAHDLPVIPHSNEMHNMHLVASQINAPFAEYFPAVEPDTGNELFWKIFKGTAVAKDGFLQMEDSPGLGIELNTEKLAELTLSRTEHGS